MGSPAFIDFLDWDHRYKSVATQIPHDGGFLPVPYAIRKILPTDNRI